MPSFDTLPPEIILLIARFVGRGYFRTGADRLLVCKAWYKVAQSVAFEDLALTIDTLQRFLAAPDRAHALVMASIKYLSIEGRNFDDEHDVEITDEIGAQGGGQGWEALAWREQRTVKIYESLVDFTAHLPQMAELKSFRLEMLMKPTASKWLEDLWIKSAVTLISSFPKSLTSVTIDNPGVPSRFSLESNDACHICPLLLARDLLPSLRHLRIRTRSICPKFFDLNNSDQRLPLKTLVINLSLSEIEMCSAHHARCCTESKPGHEGLYLNMLDAAKAAIAHLPAIRTLRVLRHKLPLFQVTSNDVVSNRRVVLPEHVFWDDVDWIDDGATDLDFEEHSDVDLFDDSSSYIDSSSSESPWIDLNVEAALQ